MLMSLDVVLRVPVLRGGMEDREFGPEPGGLAEQVGAMVDSPEVSLCL